MERYMDPSLPAAVRAEDLLGKMSLDEKMAQTVCMFPREDNRDSITV